MSSPIIYQVLFGLLFLFFCYLTYMFTKTWRWPHVTISFFLFVAAVAFCVCSARTAATHTAWKKAVQKLKGQHETAAEEQTELLHGDLTLPVQEEPSIRSLHAELGRTLLDRGRVWRNCTPTGADATTLTVTTVPPGVAEADAPPNRIAAGLVLYAFVEEVVPGITEPPFSLPEGTKMPLYYLGEFTATAVTDTEVTLQWTMPVGNYERSVANYMSGKTLALYETMPVDGHRYFALEPNKEPNLSVDEQAFGEMDNDLIAKLFEPHRANVGDRWESMVQPYFRDGGSATGDDLDDNTWSKVKFIQDWSQRVDSVGDPLGGVSESESFFDGQGTANVPMVRRGEEAQFKAQDDWGLFPQEDANRLKDEGVVELQGQVFVRSLHNYAYSFRSIVQQLIQLARNQRNVARSSAELTETNRRTLEQIGFREQETQKLNEDLAKFQLELQKITEYAAKLEQQKTSKMTELSYLYRTNLKLAEELARIERQLNERINQSTGAASGVTGAE